MQVLVSRCWMTFSEEAGLSPEHAIPHSGDRIRGEIARLLTRDTTTALVRVQSRSDGKDDNMNSTTDIPEIAHTSDPSDFTVVPARMFEDLRVGEIFRAPSRTLNNAHAVAFQAVSADNHPIHYDVEYARRHGHTAP